MAPRTRGHIDFGREGFIARFDGDPAIVARIREIQRRHWVRDKRAWIIAPHWPSVRRLLHIAADFDWEITADAREAWQRIKSESESLEYSVDVVHDNHGKTWFVCKAGDDDRLRDRIKSIPGAYWEDAWWIPTDWDACCGPLNEIVASDMRLEVSEAAWRLLEEPDVSDTFIRSEVPARELDGVPEIEDISHAVQPTAECEQAAPVERKPRVTARSKQPAAPRAEKETG
jgi:hypothetical protein